MTIDRGEITGLVLAGGRGRRMEGADKGLLLFRGRSMAEQAAKRLAPQVGSLLISANRNGGDYARLGWPVIADVLPDQAGPLAGIHATLTACATPWLATVPCDAPLLPLDLVSRLAAALEGQPDARVAVPLAAGRLQPAFLLCRRDCLNPLAAFLATGGRKLETWLREMTLVEVSFAEAAAFANINTPEDLVAIEAA
jgi:molybdopterin-guanine dinucleotide biosynthesis protein A